MKASDCVYDDKGEETWNLEVIWIFHTFTFTLCIIIGDKRVRKI